MLQKVGTAFKQERPSMVPREFNRREEAPAAKITRRSLVHSRVAADNQSTLKHFLFFHKWLRYDHGNLICRDCPRMSYEGPYNDGLEDYAIPEETWKKRLQEIERGSRQADS
jgi:hypothetical protein